MASSGVRVSIAYGLLSTLWIIVSDAIAASLSMLDPALPGAIQTIKGILFVAVTTLFLYLLLRHELSRLRRAEQSIHEKQADFHYLFQNNPRPMWVFHERTLAFLDVNQAALSRYGYSRAEFQAMTLTDIRPPEDLPLFTKFMADASTTLGPHKKGPWRHRLKNGQIIHVEGLIHEMLYQGQPAMLAVIEDVSEKVASEERLRILSGELEALIQSVPLAIVRLDLAGRVQIWNQAAEAMFGWRSAEVVGLPPPMLPADRSDELASVLSRVRAGETLMSVEFQHVRKDGRALAVIVSAAPLADGEGKIQAALMVIADITERKRLEAEALDNEKLRLALEKEIELRSLRHHFISMISHEFRNPLAVIATSSSLLERYYQRMADEARDRHLQSIQTQVSRLTEMLDDMLVVLRSESVGPQFSPQPLDLVVMCREIIHEYQASYPERALEFVSTAAAASLSADDKLLRRALANLVSNAIKYSPPDTSVRLRLKLESDHAIIQVQDQGMGIPTENMQRLFEPFYRADNVGGIQGTGLGLTIVRQAVELHGGSLMVASEVGTGTTFTVTLPVMSANSAPG